MMKELLNFKGKKALITGVANERSLAWAVAQYLHEGGAELAFTFPAANIEKRGRPLAESLNPAVIQNCDVSKDSEIESLFAAIDKKWGKLDILIHSVAYANREDLDGRFVDTTRAGFATAMDISAYSLVAMTRAAESLFERAGGGSVVTMSYLGAERVVPNYNVMGVAKAALEACVRYMAYDLGPKKIRVNAVSAGPVKTLAASGIRDFRSKLAAAGEITPLKENITAEDVAALTAFLCGPGGTHITGATYYVDSGAHIMGSVV